MAAQTSQSSLEAHATSEGLNYFDSQGRKRYKENGA